MPVISFDIGELTKEQKEILAKEFSESASRVTGLPIEMIYVLFNERKFDKFFSFQIQYFLIHFFQFFFFIFRIMFVVDIRFKSKQ